MCKHTHGHPCFPASHLGQEHSHPDSGTDTDISRDTQTLHSCLTPGHANAHLYVCACSHCTYLCAHTVLLYACTYTIPMLVHMHTRVCMHTHCAHISCEIQTHHVSCRRNWLCKSCLWHLWAASSVWVPVANISSEVATGSSCFPGCQIPTTSDPQRDRNSSGFLQAAQALCPHHTTLRVARGDKAGLDVRAATVKAASVASPGCQGQACWGFQGRTLG